MRAIPLLPLLWTQSPPRSQRSLAGPGNEIVHRPRRVRNANRLTTIFVTQARQFVARAEITTCVHPSAPQRCTYRHCLLPPSTPVARPAPRRGPPRTQPRRRHDIFATYTHRHQRGQTCKWWNRSVIAARRHSPVAGSRDHTRSSLSSIAIGRSGLHWRPRPPGKETLDALVVDKIEDLLPGLATPGEQLVLDGLGTAAAAVPMMSSTDQRRRHHRHNLQNVLGQMLRLIIGENDIRQVRWFSWILLLDASSRLARRRSCL